MSIHRIQSPMIMLIALLAFNVAFGQTQTPPRSPLQPTIWGLVYDIPETKQVKLRADVPYMGEGRNALTLDIYLPPGLKAGETRPAIVFLNAIGDPPNEKVKHWEIYRTWPRLVAAHGLTGISMDADPAHIQESLRGVFDFLAQHGKEHGVDSTRLGVYAASANVGNATRYLMGESVSQGIRAAVLYYGQPPEGTMRANLPVLYVVAASDAPRLGAPLAALWQRVIEVGAPWSLTFATGQPHAFDAFSDNDDARRIIRQTIAFWKTYLEPVPQPPWSASLAREIVAAAFGNNSQRSAELLARWVAEHPNDLEGHTQYGRALQQLRRFDEAATEFERAVSLGSTDPGVFAGLGQVRLGKQRWEDAAQFLNRAITGGFQTSLLYGQLGFAQLNLGRNEDAVRSYEKSFELGIPPGANTRGVAWYNLACGYARLGQKDKAFDALSHSIDEGMTNRARFENDADFASLRSDPRFQALLARLAGKTEP